MRGLRVAIIILLLASLVVAGYAQQANYAGAAKIVLQIVKLNTCPYSSYSSQYYSPYYTVKVLDSSDQNITVGQEYTMQIMLIHTKDFGANVLTPQPLVSGTVVGINDYWFDTSDNEINVDIQGDSADDWTQGVILLSSGNTDSTDNQQLNPVSSISNPSIFSSMPSIGAGTNFFNIPSTNDLTDNIGLTAQPDLTVDTAKSGFSMPLNMFSTGLNALPSLDSETQLGPMMSGIPISQSSTPDT